MTELYTITSIKPCKRGHTGGRYASGGCKECVLAVSRAQYAANPEKGRAASRAIYAANPEEARAAGRARYAANPEKAIAAVRARRKANPEEARAADRARHAANPEKRTADRASKAAKKLQLVTYMGGKCTDCAGIFPPRVYDFHHLDPSIKDPKATTLFRKGLTAEVIEELKKCVMLCANCHRIRHASIL